MRVMFVTSELFPWAKGGPQVVVYNLARELAREAEVEMLCIAPSGDARLREHYPGDIALRLVSDLSMGGLEYLYRNVAFVQKAKRAERPDVAHFHILPGANCFALPLFLKRMAIPLVLSVYDWVPDELPYYGNLEKARHVLHWSLAKRNLPLFDGLVVNSTYMKGVAALNGLVGAEVIPNGINVREWKDLEGLEGAECPFVLFWGKLYEKKGIERLIRAFAACSPGRAELKLFIAGRGPEEGRYRGLVEQLGMKEKVIFLGLLSDAVLKKYIASSTLCVFPSVYEGFGIAILEAMAAGKPVITSDRGGQTDFARDGENACLVEMERPGSLEKAMARLLDDEDERERLAENARRTAEGYDWGKIAPRYIDLYERISGESGRK